MLLVKILLWGLVGVIVGWLLGLIILGRDTLLWRIIRAIGGLFIRELLIVLVFVAGVYLVIFLVKAFKKS